MNLIFPSSNNYINGIQIRKCSYFFKCIQKNFPNSVDILRSQCVKSVQVRSLFWSVFSLIRTEYREILRMSPYSVRMRGKIRTRKPPYLDTFHSVISELLETDLRWTTPSKLLRFTSNSQIRTIGI